MRLSGLTAAAVLFGSIVCLAFPVGAVAADDDAGGGGGGGKQKPKEIAAKCRADADAKGLVKAEKRTFVHDCILKVRPDLAGVMKCRKEAHDKGLKDEEMRKYVKTCKQGQS